MARYASIGFTRSLRGLTNLCSEIAKPTSLDVGVSEALIGFSIEVVNSVRGLYRGGNIGTAAYSPLAELSY